MTIDKTLGDAISGIGKLIDTSKALLTSILGEALPSSGPDIIFDEQWSGCSGFQTSGPTGEDEANWTLQDCSGSTRGFDYDYSVGPELVNTDRSFGPYIHNSDCGGDSTHLYGQIQVWIPSVGTNYHLGYRMLWFNSTRGIYEPTFGDYDADEFIVWDSNWGGSAKRLTKDAWHVITFIMNNSAHTFDVDIDGTVEYSGVAMQGSSGDFDFEQFRIYGMDEGNMVFNRLIVADGKVI